MKKLVILTGASGSGKTVVVRVLKERYAEQPLLFFHFDSIGVPSTEEMEKQCGSVEEWQRVKTIEWMRKLQQLATEQTSIVFEGQMRISFIKEALFIYGLSFAQIILLDCNDAVREERLRKNRLQPELVNDQMMAWADYLRKEAQREVICTIDTSSLSEGEAASAAIAKGGLEQCLKKKTSSVQIVPYDPSWPDIFKKESCKIAKALGSNCLSIQHIGSTAVPDLCAKPMIDILAVVKSMREVAISSLEDLGFLTRGEVIPTGRYFKKHNPTIHLHLFEEGNPLIERNLTFRDWLRTHPEDRFAYGALKEELAPQYSEVNGMAYCRAKTEFIEKIVKNT